MKNVKKLFAPILVIVLLLSSLTILHNSKQTRQSGRKRIGISQYVVHQSLDQAREGFIEELAALGYVDGDNIEIVYQNAQGEQRNLRTISTQLTDSSDLVLGIATPSALSLKNTSQTTPILFTAVTDPVATNLIESMAQPGENVSGTSDHSPKMLETEVDLMARALPNVKTVGLLYTQSEPNAVLQKNDAKALLEARGYQVVERAILDSNNVKAATDSLMAEADAVLIPTDNTISSTIATIKQSSLAHKVPVFGGSADDVTGGSLFTYGTNYKELGKQTARMAVKLLEGESIASLPAEYPDSLEVYVNEEMARELGVSVDRLQGSN